MTATRKTPPARLGARGRAFWRRVVVDFDLDDPETELLVEACRTMDLCESLAAMVAADGLTVTGGRGQIVAHPALAELRQSRALLGRLLAQLELPDEDEKTLPTPMQARGRRAAAARWANSTRARRGSA